MAESTVPAWLANFGWGVIIVGVINAIPNYFDSWNNWKFAKKRDKREEEATNAGKEQIRLEAWREGVKKGWDDRAQEVRLARQEMDVARQGRDAAVKKRDAAIKERDAAVEKRDAAVEERDAAVREQDAAVKERDAARDELEQARARARQAAIRAAEASGQLTRLEQEFEAFEAAMPQVQRRRQQRRSE
ncbi:unnamed protein product [Clonostachys byssicola]|uniref:Uncharacterized protein n=1 Tax=Clonostachys byssicola TaxID=160290 RepID=A0A9N9UB22_9HYPO|nr:unnamed protein product [Clonostachys byssicola]